MPLVTGCTGKLRNVRATTHMGEAKWFIRATVAELELDRLVPRDCLQASEWEHVQGSLFSFKPKILYRDNIQCVEKARDGEGKWPFTPDPVSQPPGVVLHLWKRVIYCYLRNPCLRAAKGSSDVDQSSNDDKNGDLLPENEDSICVLTTSFFDDRTVTSLLWDLWILI